MKPSIPPFQGRFAAFLCPRIYPRIYEKGGVTPPLRFFIRGDSRKSAAAYRSALGAASHPFTLEDFLIWLYPRFFYLE